MTFPKLATALCVASLTLSACVAPDVVQRTSVTDDSLTCAQIKMQIDELDAIREEANKGRKASGKQVAAVLIFWPAAIGNYANAKEALEAADKRQEVLVGLAKKKRCKFPADAG